MPFPASQIRTDHDSAYADSGTDPTVKEHQIEHDLFATMQNNIPYNLAPIAAGMPGTGTVFLGDSNTAMSDDYTNNARGQAWPVYASIMSEQRLRYIYNAGRAGSTTADMLARFDTDVTPYAPDTVILQAGTVDAGVTDFVTWTNAMQQIVAKIRAIPAVPVLSTIMPNDSAGGGVDRNFQIRQINGWLGRYAAPQGIILLNFYGVTADPATGAWLSGYFNDGIHPNEAGGAAVGAYVASVLDPVLKPAQPPICQDDVDEPNMLLKGCFTGYSGTGLPTAWIDQAGTPAGTSISYVTDSPVKGQMVRITAAASAGARVLGFDINIGSTTLASSPSAGATSIDVNTIEPKRGVLFIGAGGNYEMVKVTSSTSGGSPYTATLARGLKYAHTAGETVVVNGTGGDKFLFTGYVTTSGGIDVKATIRRVDLNTSIVSPMENLRIAITRGVFLGEVLIPSVPQLNAQISIGSGTGWAQFGQLGIYNVSRLGWPL